ncbi:GNAT family N-acetyltransferase [Marinobacterium weihaiense]|uniref:GNAT family N-acetyltransferase n=1 Tax=Marinobacterium weihaiense TaxID=2851016 RepID=A0ABS6M9F0_9GAMM|nr:GNAT family N-acetyltransferase [Marinobacterium weihaiense]MBV0932805.1 GNAT family N-acetyltransferase [Marinobacterium weihaiense]
MNIEIVRADYANLRHADDIPMLLNEYAQDPMGGGKGLDPRVQTGLVDALARVPNAFSVLAYVDEQPAGLVNCFQAFSTFACKPIINIHDVVVLKPYRGVGLSHRMLERVETIARERGCCKVTLEVLSGNEAAKASYQRFGFAGYELDPETGVALFWEKKL